MRVRENTHQIGGTSRLNSDIISLRPITSKKIHTKETQKEKTRIGKVQETSKTMYNLYTSYEEY